METRNKVIDIIDILNQPKININDLRRASFKGIPNTNATGQADLRSIVWRVLLGALPNHASKWEA